VVGRPLALGVVSCPTGLNHGRGKSERLRLRSTHETKIQHVACGTGLPPLFRCLTPRYIGGKLHRTVLKDQFELAANPLLALPVLEDLSGVWHVDHFHLEMGHTRHIVS
jgi:hypothetical protein